MLARPVGCYILVYDTPDEQYESLDEAGNGWGEPSPPTPPYVSPPSVYPPRQMSIWGAQSLV